MREQSMKTQSARVVLGVAFAALGATAVNTSHAMMMPGMMGMNMGMNPMASMGMGGNLMGSLAGMLGGMGLGGMGGFGAGLGGMNGLGMGGFGMMGVGVNSASASRAKDDANKTLNKVQDDDLYYASKGVADLLGEVLAMIMQVYQVNQQMAMVIFQQYQQEMVQRQQAQYQQMANPYGGMVQGTTGTYNPYGMTQMNPYASQVNMGYVQQMPMAQTGMMQQPTIGGMIGNAINQVASTVAPTQQTAVRQSSSVSSSRNR